MRDRRAMEDGERRQTLLLDGWFALLSSQALRRGNGMCFDAHGDRPLGFTVTGEHNMRHTRAASLEAFFLKLIENRFRRDILLDLLNLLASRSLDSEMAGNRINHPGKFCEFVFS
jgi:hypothetical protein